MKRNLFCFFTALTFFLSIISISCAKNPEKQAIDSNIINIHTIQDSSKNNVNNNIIAETNSAYENTILPCKNFAIPVLYYHSINPNSSNEVIMTPKLFKQHMTYLKSKYYNTITLKQLNDYLTKNKPIPKKSILITFDDGYMDNYIYAFPILKELNMSATIFCIASNLDGSYYLSKSAIKEMSEYGIDIGSHTVTHSHLSALTYENQLAEMKTSKKILEDITNIKLTSIAYPFGNYNSDSIRAAKDAGFTLGFTTNKGLVHRNDDLLQLNRIYISSNYDIPTLEKLLNNFVE